MSEGLVTSGAQGGSYLTPESGSLALLGGVGQGGYWISCGPADDGQPVSLGLTHTSKPVVILLEGGCEGVRSQDPSQLSPLRQLRGKSQLVHYEEQAVQRDRSGL